VVDLASAKAEREAWIEPCPGAWCAGVTAGQKLATRRARVCRARVRRALQHLHGHASARRCAARRRLLSAEETARALELGLEATKQRTLSRAQGRRNQLQWPGAAGARAAAAAPSPAFLARYLAAWNDVRVDAFIELLHDDVRTTMPPFPMWIAGRARQRPRFTDPCSPPQRPGFVSGGVRRTLRRTRVAAFYRAQVPGGRSRLRAIQLVELRDQLIVSIDHFVLPSSDGSSAWLTISQARAEQFPSDRQSHLQDCLADNAKKGLNNDNRKDARAGTELYDALEGRRRTLRRSAPGASASSPLEIRKPATRGTSSKTPCGPTALQQDGARLSACCSSLPTANRSRRRLRLD